MSNGGAGHWLEEEDVRDDAIYRGSVWDPNNFSDDDVEEGGGGGGLGVWATDRLRGQLGYTDDRGMYVSTTAQSIAAAKTIIRDHLGLPTVVSLIQRPFDALEAHANAHPGGIVDRLGPAILNPIGLLAEGFVKLNGSGGLIEQMYPNTAEGQLQPAIEAR